MRIFLDANILFSAAMSNGAIRLLIVRLLEKRHELRISAFVKEEAERNLRAKAPASLQYFEELKDLVSLVPCGGGFKPLPVIASYLPIKDQPVLQAAIHGQCDILLTGDKMHFGKLYGQEIEKIMIHSPRSLAELLLIME